MGVYVTTDLIFGTQIDKDDIPAENILKFLSSPELGLEPPPQEDPEAWDYEEEGDLWEIFYEWIEGNTPLDVSFGGELEYGSSMVVGVRQRGFFETLWTPIPVSELTITKPITPEGEEIIKKIRAAFPDSTTEPDLILVTSRG